MRDISGMVTDATTVKAMRRMMDEGHFSAADLTWYYMERIARYDAGDDSINSVLELNPEAVFLAEALDREAEQSGPRGPLHGIPVLLKDNIDTGDKMHTSAGTLALANSRAEEDAFVAARLRDAGAIILGKTNMTEMANFMTEGMPSGYSSRGGQVKNPYGPGRLEVSGSSSGSGAAIAADFAALAVGTETSGSVLSPASHNSIVGIKPTVGLVSRSGIIPIAHSQDTAGPMARTVEDAALMLGAMVGVDEGDPATVSSVGRYHVDYTQFLDSRGLEETRLGIPRGYYEDLDSSQLSIMEHAIEVMRSAGADIVDDVEIPGGRDKWQSPVLVYEFKSALNAYLGGLDPRVPVHSLAELIHFNFQSAPATLRYGQSLLLASEKTSGTLTEREYIDARKRDILDARIKGIDAVMEGHGLDALLFPANGGASLAAKAGYPSITVPGGYDSSGLPLGVTFTARAFEEPALLRMAYGYERATRIRVAPEMVR